MTPTPPLEIRPLHLDDDAEVAALLDVCQRGARLVVPDTTLVGVQSFRAARAVPDPRIPCMSWVGLFDWRVAVAADVWGAVDGSEDDDKVSLTIDVDPDLRRRGFGSAMLAVLEREASPARPQLLGGSQFTGPIEDAPASASHWPMAGRSPR